MIESLSSIVYLPRILWTLVGALSSVLYLGRLFFVLVDFEILGRLDFFVRAGFF